MPTDFWCVACCLFVLALVLSLGAGLGRLVPWLIPELPFILICLESLQDVMYQRNIWSLIYINAGRICSKCFRGMNKKICIIQTWQCKMHNNYECNVFLPLVCVDSIQTKKHFQAPNMAESELEEIWCLLNKHCQWKKTVFPGINGHKSSLMSFSYLLLVSFWAEMLFTCFMNVFPSHLADAQSLPHMTSL